MTLPITCS